MVEMNIHVQVPLATGEAGGYQRIRKGRGPGNVNPLAVKKCAGPALGGEHLVAHRVENHARDQLALRL